jgi:hypothetical protein
MAKMIVCRATARGWYRGQRFWPGDKFVIRQGDDMPPWAETVETPAEFNLAWQSKRRKTTFADVMKQTAAANAQPKNATQLEAMTLADLNEPLPQSSPYDAAAAAREMLS